MLVLVLAFLAVGFGSVVRDPAGGPGVEVATPPTALGPREFEVEGPVTLADPPHGCAPLVGGPYNGTIVLVAPNLCYPYQKAKNAQDAGAAGVLLRGYRDTFGLLIWYRGPDDGDDVVVPVAELWRSDETVGAGDNVTLSPSPNPMVDSGQGLWIVYTILFAVFDLVTLLFAGYKLFFYLAMTRERRGLPLWVLGLTVVTCLIRIPILVDPTGSRGIYSWGTVEAFLTLDFSFAVVVAGLIAFHWHAITRIEGRDFEGSSKRLRTTGFVAYGLLLVVEVVTSVMRGMLLPAMPFLMGKVFLYLFTSAPTGTYFAWSGRKILKMARDPTGRITDRMKQKARVGFGITGCLLAFPITAFLVATPLYDPPVGYFLLRYFAGFWLYTATFLCVYLFETVGGQSQSAAKWSSTAGPPVPSDSVEID